LRGIGTERGKTSWVLLQRNLQSCPYFIGELRRVGASHALKEMLN
jgi:hypothetical protein